MNPQEAKRFQNIDKNYMKIVTSAVETQNVVNTCYGNELMKTMLPHLLEQLELCQKVRRVEGGTVWMEEQDVIQLSRLVDIIRCDFMSILSLTKLCLLRSL